jgi:1-deoxy-D-xylulose-5-phosphate synthase
MRCGDDLLRAEENRHVVAVVGDGAFSCGTIFEAMNNAGGLKKNLIVILNDNKMSICPRVGGLAESLDHLRTAHFYTGLKVEVQKLLTRVPVIGEPMERFLSQMKDALKAGLLGGMIFEDLGFRYIGPVDGHNVKQLQKYLKMVRQVAGPVLLHVVTEKGHGFKPAVDDPTRFHAPAPFQRENGSIVRLKKASTRPAYTEVMRDSLLEQMRADKRVVAITAAMCQGTMLEPVRDEFPDRFFDVGICESHAVAFAAGLAKTGLRPVIAIYSTFLQRSYDQIFQEMSLQNLPVTLLLDRAGLVGPDGPTHHGVFDLTYLRPMPNLVVMAPGDATDVAPMLDWALHHDGPVAIRYPKAPAETISRGTIRLLECGDLSPLSVKRSESSRNAATSEESGDESPHSKLKPTPIELARAEVLHWGGDGMFIACGTLLGACNDAAKRLAADGIDFGAINARFVKPLDTTTILRAIRECPVVVTVEEGMLMGGFGSAVLEAAAEAGLDAGHVRRLGIPDRYIEHGPRNELLADLGLDVAGIVRSCRQWTGQSHEAAAVSRDRVIAKS